MLLSCADINHFKEVSSVSQATVCAFQTFLSLLCVPSKSAHSFVWENKMQSSLSVITDFDDSSSGAHMLIPHPYACTRIHAHAHVHRDLPWYFTHKFHFPLVLQWVHTFSTRHLMNYGRWRIITILPEGLYSGSLDSNEGVFIFVMWTVSQGERGLPGLPGDVVSIKNRAKGYTVRMIFFRITGLFKDKWWRT